MQLSDILISIDICLWIQKHKQVTSSKLKQESGSEIESEKEEVERERVRSQVKHETYSKPHETQVSTTRVGYAEMYVSM